MLKKVHGLKLLTLAFLLLATGFSASAQRSRAMYNYGGNGGNETNFGLSFGIDYDQLLGDLGPTFKPAPAFDGGFSYYMGNLIIGLHTGYREYQPQQELIYNPLDSSNTVTKNYTILSFYTSFDYNIPITDGIKIFFGLNTGAYYTTFGYSQSSSLGLVETKTVSAQGYLAPKSGMTFYLSNGLSLSLQAKYNLFTGRADASSTDMKLYQSVGAGVNFLYRF